MPEGRFLEIEHKFVVGPDFDPAAFRERVNQLGPGKSRALTVEERYFLLEGVPGHVFRYKSDDEIQLLTVKSFESDPEVRLEVDLDLGLHAGDQSRQVVAFLEVLGIAWRATIAKKLEVFYFPDCEIVYYEASTQEGGRAVRCVEFEALGAESEEEARSVLAGYEEETGFAGLPRSKQSLIELLDPREKVELRSRFSDRKYQILQTRRRTVP